ncbi:PLDc N-terminal domain-containing protein [Fabibacter sp. E12]|nr:PLDc N-terminal domain-containing protein [Roseivirga sp. E12]
MFFMLIILYIIPFIFVVMALIDVIRSEFRGSNDKLIWVLVIILMPVIGSILYYFFGRKQKISQ